MSAINQVQFPSLPLQPYVKCYTEIYMGTAGEAVGCKLPAKLEQCIFFCISDIPFIESPSGNQQNILSHDRCCYIRGTMNAASLQLNIHGVLAMFVVIFHPTGFFRLFGIPGIHFTDTFTVGGFSIGKDWEMVGADIRNTGNMNEKVLLVERYLLQQLRKNTHCVDPVDSITNRLLYNPGLTVKQMAVDSYLCERQFRRKFIQRTGITPQTFSRICRTNNILKLKQQNPQRSWYSLIQETGFTDASHFRREMKALMGIEQPGFQANDKFINVQDTHFKLLEKRAAGY